MHKFVHYTLNIFVCLFDLILYIPVNNFSLPSLSYQLSLRLLFCLFLSGRFTQVLLYAEKVISRQHFTDKNLSRIRVNYCVECSKYRRDNFN